jgi:outer membrane PBP1 activator LpoA protein
MLNGKKNRIVTFLAASLLLLPLLGLTGSKSYSANKSEQLIAADKNAQYYCTQAQHSETPEKEANYLLCANALLKNHKINEAQDALSKIKKYPFTGNLLAFKHLVDARYALAVGNVPRAIAVLQPVSVKQLSLPLTIEYHDLLARAYEENGELINSVNERIALDDILSDTDLATENNALIWASLQNINPKSLEAAAKNTQNPILKGWLELALLERDISRNDPNYPQALAHWEGEYRSHPAKSLLPSNVSSQPLQALQVRQIALLLPLTGSLSSTAEAIRDGFLAASSLATHYSHAAPRILVIDTQGDKQIERAYRSAVDQGADLIVGPLTKNGVEQLVSIASRDHPILALNTIESSTPSNVFQLSLAPEDEARQAADRAFQDGHLHALIIAQSGDWGDRLVNAFQARWESLGGQVVSVTRYSSDDSLSKTVKTALRVDASESRAKELRSDINHPLDYEVRRRQDIDMVFMVAQPREARQIPPLLAFYYAQDLPVFATSSVYSGYPNPHADKDLDGVTFCDIPWNIDARPFESISHDPIAQLWPTPGQTHPRLYALGVDAYEIVALLPRLEALPNFSMNGATGKLSLNKDRQLVRSLRCTRFISGEPKRLESNV